MFADLLRRRLEGAPLQYLEGTAAFGPFELVVDERVLIPRPETEQLWELAVAEVSDPSVVVDLCTGSGALAIACKSTWPAARVIATDLSPDAVDVARLNVARARSDVEVLQGDLFEALPPEVSGLMDLIVSNPPYVTDAEFDDLPPDVKAEPRMALVSGPTGLEVLDRIGVEAVRWLAPGGTVICEIGDEQGPAVTVLFKRAFASVSVRRDLTGRDRFVVARR